MRRSIELLTSIAGGKVADHADTYPKKATPKSVTLTLSRLLELGGVNILESKVLQILNGLQIPAKKIKADEIKAEIPYFRTDIQREEDLIEEVLRIYGYDKIPSTIPHNPPPHDLQSNSYLIEEDTKDIMISLGFDEEITQSLTNEKNPVRTPVKLENSLNSENVMLRTSLKQNLLYALTEQKKYRKQSIKLFEVGKIYYMDGKNYKEEKVLAAISTDSNSYAKMKGVVEAVFEQSGYSYDASLVTIETIDKKTYYFELRLQELLKKTRYTKVKIFTAPPQVILEDISIVVPSDVKVGELIEAIKEQSTVVSKVSLGEEPRDFGEGKKTVFLHITYLDKEKTMSTDDVTPIRSKIIGMLENLYKAKLR